MRKIPFRFVRGHFVFGRAIIYEWKLKVSVSVGQLGEYCRRCFPVVKSIRPWLYHALRGGRGSLSSHIHSRTAADHRAVCAYRIHYARSNIVRAAGYVINKSDH